MSKKERTPEEQAAATEAARVLGRMGGKVKTPAKQAAGRLNMAKARRARWDQYYAKKNANTDFTSVDSPCKI